MYSSFSTLNIAANTKNANLLADDINQLVGVDSIVNVYAVASAADIRITVFADSDVAVDDKEIVNIGTTLDKSAHLVDSFIVTAGTRLAAFLRNGGAVATTDILTGFEVLPA